MYGTSGSCGKKQRPLAAGYLSRPKLGTLRTIYPAKPLRPSSAGYGFEKRKKARKTNETKMEFRKRPDYADTAYREAVSRLRILLAESYTPLKRPTRELDSAGEETDNQSLLSGASRTSKPSHIHYRYSPTIPRRYPYYTPIRSALAVTRTDPEKNVASEPKWETSQRPPELVSFIERQEDYIEQLERESKLCRSELTNLLRKVKDVISENEDLHDKQKTTLIKTVFDRLETETETETEPDNKTSALRSPRRTRRVALEGPAIVFESRISELEAQLTQTKIELRKAIEENESYKRKISDGSLADGIYADTFKKQIETLQREKGLLQDTVSKLQSALAQQKDKENINSDQVKRSLDAAEQAQYEKNAAEHEIRRLKDELERQHGKLRDTIGEQSRRIADERNAMERRYSQQIEQLTTELGVQWEATSKVQLELEKQRRENSDLRRELAQKQAYVDELKKEMQVKIGCVPATMQSDIGLNGAEKSALEQQISTLQLSNERNDRQGRQEAARLQAELQSMRQRLDRADADLIHSRRENIRLSEQIGSLEKEIKLNAALTDERSKRSGGGEAIALPPPAPGKEELSSMVRDMETKHDEDYNVPSTRRIAPHPQQIAPNQTMNYARSPAVVDKNLSRTSSNASMKPSTPPRRTSIIAGKPTGVIPEPQPDPNQQQYPTDQEYMTYPEQEYVDPNQQYAYDPNADQQYGYDQQYDPNVQYSADPNQSYMADPNQEYAMDPNQVYETDPNQAYRQEYVEQQPTVEQTVDEPQPKDAN